MGRIGHITKRIQQVYNLITMTQKKSMSTALTFSACILWVFGITVFSSSFSQANPHSQAIRLFDRLTGIPISLSDPRLAQMENLIANGKLGEAAKVASDDDHFFNLTIKKFAAPMSNRSEDPTVPLNDFSATVIGMARDDIDARNFFTADYIYKSSVTGTTTYNPDGSGFIPIDIQVDQSIYKGDMHYLYLDSQNINLRQSLVQIPQKAFPETGTLSVTPDILPDTAGLITTRAWATEHFNAGTNRRVTEFIFREFLCTPVKSLRDASMLDERVRQDVSRIPSGNSNLYQTTCRSCHGGLDGNTGAFAYFDGDRARGGFLVYKAGLVRDKYSQNQNYADGFATRDDSWVNHYINNQNAFLGWKGSTSGYGAHQLGIMFSNTDAFPSCMATRAFNAMCKHPPTSEDQTWVNALATDFQKNGYKLRRLFEQAAMIPSCLGD